MSCSVTKQLGRLILATGFICGLPNPVAAQLASCTSTSVARTPIPDLATNFYNGFMGGLYPNGSNVRPPGHESSGLLAAARIRPLDSSGQFDSTNGQIGFVSIGMSNTNYEFEVFEHIANVDVNRNPRVTMVNGAQAGQTSFQWANGSAPVWTELANAVSAKGLTNAQVQVAWIKSTVRSTDVGGWESYPPFPATATITQTMMKTVVRNLKEKYPNIHVAYLSSRIYGGYGPGSPYPEPVAYEEGFGIKWLIEEQINGDPLLDFASATPVAPYLAWGPYLWADGLGSDGVPGGVPGRSDGLEYACEDFTADGMHPTLSGRQKVANQLLDFLRNDSIAGLWYVNPNPPPVGGTPYYLDLDGVDDYLEVADADNLSFTNGVTDTAFTLEGWFRPDSMSGKQNLISKWTEGQNLEYRFYISNGLLRLDLRDVTAGATTSVYTNNVALAGSWHHLAVTYDGRGGSTAGNGISIYIDGVAVPVTRANNSNYVRMSNRPQTLQIGRETNRYQQYNGALDELRIWNVALSQSQIQAQRFTELTGAEPGLVAYWRMNEGIGATVADDALGDNPAIQYNNPAWATGGPMDPPPPDLTPPTISNVATTNLSDSGITIRFDTNEVTTGWVSYSRNFECPCGDVDSQGTGTTHIVNLTGLAPNTLYVLEAKAMDSAGNLQVAPTVSFVTLVEPPDLSPPTVQITSPSPGNVAGTVLVQASAADNRGVAGVQFRLDGIPLGAEDLTFPYSISWDTQSVADGSHALTAEARDAANNYNTSSVAVNVRNQPVVSTPYYLDLDGVDDYLGVADADNLSFTNGVTDTPFTLEGWFRPDSMSGKQILISKWTEGQNLEYRFYISNGLLRLDLRDVTAGATTSVYTNNVSLVGSWHHLGVTYDGRGGSTAGNGISIYIDGVAVPVTRANNPSYVRMSNRPQTLQIGRETNRYQQYNGALDEIRIWNVALSQSQIQAQRFTELTGAEPGLVAYWRMNEGVGATVADDALGDNPAIQYNNPAWAAGGPVVP